MKALVLAAGLSRRMRRQKLLLPFGEATVIATVLEAVRQAPFTERIAVISKELEPLIPAYAPDWRVIVNPAPEKGMASSLRLGLEALGENDGFCVLLGDLPLVESLQIARHAQMFQERGKGFSALIPVRDGAQGHPAFFASVWRERLLRAQGDMGGRDCIRAHAGEVLRVPGEDAFFMDMDTPEDYERLRALYLATCMNR